MNLRFVFIVKESFLSGDLPEIGFKFPLSPQCLVSCGDVSKGVRVIEKTARCEPLNMLGRNLERGLALLGRENRWGSIHEPGTKLGLQLINPSSDMCDITKAEHYKGLSENS